LDYPPSGLSLAMSSWGARIAAYISWPAGNPFQLEVAVANLSYGILELLCLKFRDDFFGLPL